MTNLIGQSLGRYHVLEQLGEGGMATVYKAFDTRLETEVAVKVIRTDNILPRVLDRAIKRFDREAKALAKLTHANIVKVIDYGEYEGNPYLVMPYLPGGTLKERLKGKPLSWQESARLLIPIARALDFAHRQGMIHRDVKPSNIIITADGDPMLTDFGIAKILDLEETVDLTGTNAAVGTPEYMAPEQTTSNKTDHRVDIYALGVVFYEMVTGRKPYIADTPMAVLIKHASEPLPRPKQFAPDLPQAVENILLKALTKNPEDRYQNMGEFVTAMERLLSGKLLKEEIKDTKQVRLQFRNRKSVFRIISGVVGILLIALLVTWLANYGFFSINLPIATSIPPTPAGLIHETDGTIGPSTAPTSTRISTASTATYTLSDVPVFEQDFENGNTAGFRMKQGSWKVISEDTSNKVLQTQETRSGNWPYIEFGPLNFSDGVIKYRFYVKNVADDYEAGTTYLFFRVAGDWTEDSYTLQIRQKDSLELLEYVPPIGDNWATLGSKARGISTNQWYTVRVEILDWVYKVYLNDNLIINAVDPSQRVKAGRLGFQGSPKTTIWFDDVSIWEFESTPSITSTSINTQALPSQTQIMTQTNVPNASNKLEQPVIYDDFDNPVWDGKLNSNLWVKRENCASISQEDSNMVFRNRDSSCDLIVAQPRKISGDELGNMEARLMVSSDHKGGTVTQEIDFFTYDLPGGLWYSFCGVYAKNGSVQILFSVEDAGAKKDPELLKTIPAKYDQWYEIRLEVDPQDMRFSCFIDGVSIGGIVPKDAETLRNAQFERLTEAFRSQGASATSFLDYIKLQP